MNYLGKFGIEFNPFVKNSKEIKVEFTQSKELLFRLVVSFHIRKY